MEEFSLPFGGRLLRNNRWMRLAGLMPWEYIEEIYAQNMSGETGRPAISSRITFGAIFIKEYCHITGEDTAKHSARSIWHLSAGRPGSLVATAMDSGCPTGDISAPNAAIRPR